VHPEALEWCARWSTHNHVDVLDIGGRNVNGTPEFLFSRARYRTLDAIPAPDVDIVADAATWVPDRAYDVVVCTEVLEHTEKWRQICRTAWEALRPGGMFIMTCAGPGRAPHSGIDGEAVRQGEWYENINPIDLEVLFDEMGMKYEIDIQGPDVRAVAWKVEHGDHHD